jgi:anti-sigma regulatory factor (Ser/Thr protein kinase)
MSPLGSSGMDELTIELSGAFSLKQERLERMLRLLQPLYDLTEPTIVHLDLGRLVSISPSALALLVASLHTAGSTGLMVDGSRITPPHAPHVSTYIQRMNLLRWLPGFAHVGEPFERHQEQGFRGCLQFQDSTDYWRAASELTDALCERCAADDTARAAVRVCLDEVAENVIHHAGAPAGFAAAQGWKRTNEFEIAIVDLGVGVRTSLRKNELYSDVPDDATAIATALRPQVTSTPERNSGIGLFVTRMVLKSNGGSLLVRSGNGAVYSGGEERIERTVVEMPGTLVAIRANTDRPFDMDAVYADLPPIDDV